MLLRVSCHRQETLDYQGFTQQRAPGVSGFASAAAGF
jgi:hypothetical protein